MRLRLSYLDIKGLAEPIRLALAIGGLEFEDVRLSYAGVADLRAAGRLPFGQVPVLEVDGIVHAQAGALLRWAGGRAGLYPEALRLHVDAALEALADIRVAMRPAWYGSALGRHPLTGELFPAAALSAEQAGGVAAALNEAILPARLAQLEAVLARSGGPHLCGAALTVCDLDWYVMAAGLADGTYCDGVAPGVLDGCAGLRALAERVAAHPRVVEWEARASRVVP